MKWDAANVERLKRLRAAGLSCARTAPHFGCSRSAICGAIHRHVHGNLGRQRASGPRKLPQMWTEHKLTETWAARKLRRQQGAGQ